MQSNDWKLTNYVLGLVTCEDSWDKSEKAVQASLFVLFAMFVLQFPLIRAYRYINFSIPVISAVSTYVLTWTPLCAFVRVFVYLLCIVTAVIDISIFAVTNETIRYGVLTIAIIAVLIYSVS
jgi:hypothetical protein